MRSKKTFNGYLLCFFLTAFLVTGTATYGAEPGLSGGSGSQPGVLTVSEIKNLPATSSEAQALKHGYELVPSGEQVVGDTGKPGLGGASGSQPSFLPAPGNAKAPASASEAQALRDGYELVPSGKQVVGNTGKPGLEGASGSQPSFLPAPGKGGATANTKEK